MVERNVEPSRIDKDLLKKIGKCKESAMFFKLRNTNNLQVNSKLNYCDI